MWSETKPSQTKRRLQTQLNRLNHSPRYHHNHLSKRYNITPIQMACYLFSLITSVFGFLLCSFHFYTRLFIDLSEHYDTNKKFYEVELHFNQRRFVNRCLVCPFMEIVFPIFIWNSNFFRSKQHLSVHNLRVRRNIFYLQCIQVFQMA